MVRVPVVDSHPYVVHVSDCLDNLKPGDHIEIQWRGSIQAPYGILLNPQALIWRFWLVSQKKSII